MNPRVRRIEWLIWGGLALVVASVLLLLTFAQLKFQLLVGKPLPVIGPVSEFTLTNLDGRAATLADLRGHVWVADIIFTTCPGPCLKMSRQMKELQQALAPANPARLVSLTTYPEYDKPPVLRAYAERFGADTNRWLFLTGTKAEIRKLAVESLKLTAVEKKPEERESPQDLFIHSTIFVVIDKHAQLRGIFETTGEGVDPQQAKVQILSAIRRLEREK